MRNANQFILLLETLDQHNFYGEGPFIIDESDIQDCHISKFIKTLEEFGTLGDGRCFYINDREGLEAYLAQVGKEFNEALRKGGYKIRKVNVTGNNL